jgi:calcium-dependent protein kinase
VFKKIRNGSYHFDHDEFKACSSEVIDLIKSLLVVNPKDRLSAKEALEHKWFKLMEKGTLKENTAINKDVLERLQAFRGVSKLKKAAMNMLVKMADQRQIEELRKDFVAIDKDGTGLINANELKEAIKQSNI